MILHKVHDLWRFVMDYIDWYYPYILWLRHYQLSRHKHCSCVIHTWGLQANWLLEFTTDWYYNFDKWEHNKTAYVFLWCTVKYEYIHTLGRLVEQDSIARTCTVSTFHPITICLGESDPFTFKPHLVLKEPKAQHSIPFYTYPADILGSSGCYHTVADYCRYTPGWNNLVVDSCWNPLDAVDMITVTS